MTDQLFGYTEPQDAYPESPEISEYVQPAYMSVNTALYKDQETLSFTVCECGNELPKTITIPQSKLIELANEIGNFLMKTNRSE